MRPSSLLLSLVAFSLCASCSSTKRRSQPEDPYATENQFCTEWAKAACNAKVVEACSGTTATEQSIQSCVTSQTVHCLGLVPPNYASDHAQECIAAVANAYADARLSVEDLALLTESANGTLAAPCDKLNKGPKVKGDICYSSDDCDSLQGLTCMIKAGEPSGTCQVPVEVGGGKDCSGVDEACAAGFYCNGSNCIEKQGANESCDPVSQPCLEDLQCLGTGTMYCKPKVDDGQYCTDHAQCKSGICAKNVSGNNKCVPSVTLAPTEPTCADLG